MENFKNKTIKGLSFSFAGQLFVQVLRIVTYILLARFFLIPTEFGLFSLALIIFGISNILTDFGFGKALIQHSEVNQTDYSTAFWINAIIGFTLFIVLYLGAFKIAEFFNEPQLEIIIQVLSPVFLLNSLTIIHKTILQKNLEFRYLALNDAISMLAGCLVAIILGYMGYGVWALVMLHLTMAVVSNIWFWIAYRHWRPLVVISKSSINKILHFSLYIFSNNALNYAAKNVDKAIIGKFFSSHLLGIYSQASALVLLPVANISNVFVKVLFPSFSIIQKEKERIARMFIKTSKTVLMINSLIFVCLFLVADLFVIDILGDKWVGMEEILRIFCFIGLLISLRTIQSGIYMSQNKNKLLLTINFVIRIATIIAFFAVTPFGFEAIGYAYLVMTVFSYFVTSYYSCKVIDLKFDDFLRSHGKLLLSSILAYFLSYLVFDFFESSYHFVQMILISIIFMIAYVSLLGILKEKLLPEIVSTIRSRYRSKVAA